VVGCDAVEHTASPFHFRVTDPYLDLVNPAVNGTLGLLNSALKEPKIKRVVITSSFASIVSPKPVDYVFTEQDWNESSPALLKKHGKDTEPAESYRTSKVLAEKAAWKFVQDHTDANGVAPFDLTTICPPLIIGPLIQECTSPEALNTSLSNWYAFLTGKKKDSDSLIVGAKYVDVRDVAYYHVEALLREKAGGQRFACCHDRLFYQKLLDFIHSPAEAALLADFPNATKGTPGAQPAPSNSISSKKSTGTSGLEAIQYGGHCAGYDDKSRPAPKGVEFRQSEFVIESVIFQEVDQYLEVGLSLAHQQLVGLLLSFVATRGNHSCKKC